jgi:hypothetical protein
MEMRGEGSFFDEQDLDRCIPMEEVPLEDILYHFNDHSLSSNYSKLERTLCGMGASNFHEDCEDNTF